MVFDFSELFFAQIPLPLEPPWWSVFGAEKAPIYEISRTITSLYSRPKAVYVRVTEDAWQHSDVPTEVNAIPELVLFETPVAPFSVWPVRSNVCAAG